MDALKRCGALARCVYSIKRHECYDSVKQCSDDAAFRVLVYHLAGLLGLGNHSFNAFSP
jgi:hypothetical protein